MVSEFLSRGTLSGTQTAEQTAGVEQQFLRFHLIPDTTVLLAVHQMTEVLTIPVGEIVPIPQLPPWVMGVYNWRGEILWMVDLGHLVGLTPLYQQAINRSNYTAVVVHAEQQSGSRGAGSQNTSGKKLGLVVNRLEDMEWCNPDLIQSPPQSSVSSELVKFLRGYWLKTNGDIMVVLDANSIIARMPQPESNAS